MLVCVSLPVVGVSSVCVGLSVSVTVGGVSSVCVGLYVSVTWRCEKCVLVSV